MPMLACLILPVRSRRIPLRRVLTLRRLDISGARQALSRAGGPGSAALILENRYWSFFRQPGHAVTCGVKLRNPERLQNLLPG